MGKNNTFPVSSRYDNTDIISGYVKTETIPPTIFAGRGFSCTRLAVGTYQIYLKDDYFFGTGKDKNMLFCEACAQGAGNPLLISDLRRVLVAPITVPKKGFDLQFRDYNDNLADPTYGFTFSIFISNSKSAGEA